MTQFINLDEIKREPLVTIQVNGQKHEMRTATVEDFIENMKAIESLGKNASLVQEIEVMIGIVARAFPTLPENDIRSWPIDNLQKLSEIARGLGGEIVTDNPEKAKEAEKSGNAPTAG